MCFGKDRGLLHVVLAVVELLMMQAFQKLFKLFHMCTCVSGMYFIKVGYLENICIRSLHM